MSEPDETNETADSDSFNVDLAGLIEKHSSLLVVAGVFAATAVYISQTAPSIGTETDAQLMYATGFVSALGMTLLFLALTYKQLADDIGSWSKLHHAHYHIKNLPLALFTLFNAMLVLSIAYLIYRFEPVIFILVLVITVFAGCGVVLRLLYALGRRLPKSPKARLPLVFVVSVAVAFGTDFALDEFFAGVEITTIQQMSLTEPVPAVTAVVYLLLVSIRAAGALGVIGSILGIPVVLVDKYRGTGAYDTSE